MRIRFILFVLLFQIATSQNAQTLTSQYRVPITPGGYFDKVFDKDGREYFLENLAIREIGQGDNGINSVISATCQSGIFIAHFANGSGMASPTNTFEIACRNTVCQVLENVSGLLGWTGTWPAGGYVHILVDDISLHATNPSISGVLGLASSFYAFPINPFSPNPGLIKNQMQKTIQSKTNAWTNVVSPLNSGGMNYYHGFMAFNFSNPSFTWNPQYTVTATANQYDLYTVILHEVTHALGFASLIGSSGFSKFGPMNNYYSSYDNHLYANNNATKLLTSTGCSTLYGLSFNLNPVSLQPACPCPTCYTSDFTNCNAAIKYNSSLVPNMPVYTPDCFEPPSSLSHFEDMCLSPSPPYGNNLYFTMSNANGTGTNKRFLKQEERNVLCDLGYTVAATYTSAAASATTSYTGGPCTSPDIWGINDGISGNAYTYTTAANVLTMAISGAGGILANDAPAATSATCIETVYNNGTVSVTGNTISFTAATGFTGIILLRYIPQDASGNHGNITYILGYIFPAQCNPVSPCDMVQNGGFEQNSNCGAMGGGVGVSCWQPYSLNPDLLVENCTFANTSSSCNLGISTMFSTPTFSSHNMTSNPNNNAVVGLGGWASPSGSTHVSESLSNYLGTPLLSGQTYSISFWAYQYSGMKNDPLDASMYMQNQSGTPLVLSFGTSSAPVLPQTTFSLNGLTPLLSTTLSNIMNTWQFYSYQFTYTPVGGANGVFLYAGPNSFLNYSIYVNAGSPDGQLYRYYMLLDEISIKSASLAPNFALPQSTICAAIGYTDLAQYVSIPGGTFTGVGVSTVSTGGSIQYNFNSPPPTPSLNGLYTITYTYTDNIGCQQATYFQINVSNILPGVSVTTTFTPQSQCSNTGTLAVISPSAGYSFTWQPIGVNSPTAVTTVSTTTTFSALATTTAGCSIMGTILVPPNIPPLVIHQPSLCTGGNATLNIPGTYTSIVWQPGNSTSPTYTINDSQTIYTVSITNSIGCTNTATFTPSVLPLPTLSLSTSPASVCMGGTSTITATGSFAVAYFLSPIFSFNSTLVVTPTANITYTAGATSTNGCMNTATVLVSLFPNPGILLSGTYLSVCPSNNNTLTATLYGVNTLTWLPMGSTVNPIVVSPSVSSTYTAIATNSFGCSAQNTITIGMNSFSVNLSSNTLCPFQTASITATGNYSSVVWQPGSVSGSVLTVPTGTPNTYTATATYSSGCTLSQTVTLPLIDAGEYALYFTNTPTAGICSGNQATVNLAGNISFTVLTWNPGGYTTAPIVVTPSVPTQYTVQILTAPNCTHTVVKTLNVKTDCCTSGTVVPFSAVTQSLTNLTGINIINFPINIPSSNTVNVSGELIMAPGASISVNGVLKLDGAHLYSCGSAMWDGIMLMPGSTFSSEAASYSNLIEDAKTAVTVFAPAGNGFGQWSNPNSYQPATCHVSNTIFNKNNEGISIAHFPLTTTTNYNFKVISTVFTCRDFTFNPTTWPQTGITNSTLDLRYDTPQASTVLSSPFLMNGYTVAVKKSPYSTASSSVGINIRMVGTTTSGSIYPITVGDPTSDYYNIFDSHAFGINAENSHLNSFNNVFQNTHTSSGWVKSAANGGMGIRHVNTYYSANRNIVWFTNARLNLVSPSNPAVCNNKFYDCHTGVYIAGTATVNIRYALFSSAQSTASTSGPTVRGHQGIAIQSNKFHDYQIHTNKFLNLNTGIKADVKFDYVSLTPPTTTYGEAWGTFSCTANYFSAASANGAAIGSGYMAKGIYIGVPAGSSTVIPNIYSVGAVNGIKITYNNFDRVRTGVEMLGLLSLGYQKAVSNNAINLAAETNTNNAQYGIKVAYNGKSIVNTNTVVGLPSLKNVNLNVAGILHQENLPKADVRYNSVSTVARGFEFKDKNPLAVWRCNSMSNCHRGMQASNWGTIALAVGIGTQGSAAQRCGNTWTAISFPDQQTYTDASSNATNSPLWVANTGPEALVLGLQSGGGPVQWSYASAVNAPTTTASSYCANPWNEGGCLYCFIGEGGEEEYDVDAEIADMLLFSMLDVDSIIAMNNDTLMQWYEGLEEEVGTLYEIEGNLAKGDFEAAQELINGYTPETNVQTNFRDYFQIYHNYAIDDTMNTSDSTDLFILASQCPGRDGPAIHKARALYNMAYNTILAFNDDSCERIGYSERQMNNGEVRPKSELNQLLIHESGQIKGKLKLRHNLTIYPNPAQEILYIRGSKTDETVNLRITDLQGRSLMEEKLVLNNNKGINLDLINGIYFVYITNSKGEKTTKKLIISK